MSATTHRIKNTETLISLAIIGILVVIGLAVVVAQNRFSPAVVNFVSPTNEAPTSAVAIPLENLIDPLPLGLKAMSSAERFDTDTLSNKINGKAELYLSAGFVQLNTQRFSAAGDVGSWFELYSYDMGSPSNAFAVFSTQRRQDVTKLDLTRYAYETSNAIFFTTGQHYVEMIGATSGSGMTALLKNVARHVLATADVKIDPKGETKSPEQVFPAEGLVADSLTLIAKDAFGFNRLDQVYTARYQRGETETILFVSARSSAKEATMLAQAYRDFLIEFGGIETPKSDKTVQEDLYIVEIMDAFEIIFSKGPYLAGVHMAENKEAALGLANLLKAKLNGAVGPLQNNMGEIK